MKNNYLQNVTDTSWKIIVGHSCFWLTKPEIFACKEFLPRWVDLQTRVLEGIHDYFADSQVLVRFNTRFAESYYDLQNCYPVKISPTKHNKENVFYINGCTDTAVWKRIFLADSFSHESKMFYIFTTPPSDWSDVMDDIYGLINKTKDLHRLDIDRIKAQKCCCVCMNEDSDLLILRVNLPDNILRSIIEGQALVENLKILHEFE